MSVKRLNLTIAIWLCQCGSVFCQSNNIHPYFEFTQIDSLANDAIAKTIKGDSSATVVTFVNWNEGARSHSERKKIGHYIFNNPFEIYSIYTRGRKVYIQKIDNFGYFKPEPIRSDSLLLFLNKYFEVMAHEKMNGKVDTVFNSDGSIRYTTTTSYSDISIERVKAHYKHDQLSFEYQEHYADNKYNQFTRQYSFLLLLRRVVVDYAKRKNHKRIAFLYKSI